MLKEFEASKSIKYVILSSRRIGKSFALVTLAIEAAMKRPNQYIKYASTTTDSVRGIVQPLFNQILQTCPEPLRPTFNMHMSKWIFPNGSEILLRGVDKDKGEGLRGQACDLGIVDEAGFVDCLSYLVSDILMPMIIEREGRLLFSSTPPKKAAHPFLFFIAEAERRRALSKRVLTDCPRFTPKKINTFIEEAGGKHSETCRREYFCQIIRDLSASVVPEFRDGTKDACIIDEIPHKTYHPDTYVSLDPGFVDNTGILFGFWDFENANLIIQREYVGNGNNTEEIASIITTTEAELWHGFPPYKRVSDTDLRLIEDLKILHKLKFIKTEKDNKEAQINQLRLMVKNKQIKIHSSCVNLISQLSWGQFKVTSTGRRDFQRTEEHGHLDLLDALLYLIRNLNKSRNPVPEDMFNQYTSMDYWRDFSKPRVTDNAKKLSQAFNRR